MITGLDHIYLSVSDFEGSEAFYDRVMALLGFRKGDAPIAGEPHAHYFNPALQLTIRPARSAPPDPIDPTRGRRSGADMKLDAIQQALQKAGIDGRRATD